jgi:UDP-2-acetamido-2-deoxy-ribo-hexuluronate aminotransferase
MHVEAIYREGRLEFLTPLRLRQGAIRMIVEVPEEAVEAVGHRDTLPAEVVARARSMRATLDAIRNAPPRELQRTPPREAKPVSPEQLAHQSRSLLKAFVADKHWLAALAGEGAVFDVPNPASEQLLRALARFPSGSIKLLTRDEALLEDPRDLCISPEDYLQLPVAPPAVGFVDLKTQQDALRPELEQGLHRVLHHGQYILGPEVTELERRLALYTGAKHCVTAASGTDALLISLMALGIGPGDEVITTPIHLRCYG